MDNNQHVVLDLERSRLLKALGFDEPCFIYYDTVPQGEYLSDVISGTRNSENKYFITYPTYLQTIDWFRNKYNIFCYVIPTGRYWDWFAHAPDLDASAVDEHEQPYEAYNAMLDAAIEHVAQIKGITDVLKYYAI
jgi:hypothetical protein